MTRSRRLSSLVAGAAVVVFVVVALSGSQAPKEAAPPAEQPAKRKRPAGKPIAMSGRTVNLEIRLGLKDTKASLKDKKRVIWDGSIEVSEGRVVEIETLRGNMRQKSKDGRFKARSLNNANQVVRPQLHVRLDAPESATVTVSTEPGKFNFKLADLGVGASKLFLDGQVRVEREQGAVRLTGPETEDDYPVMARGKDGTTWLAYVAYQPGREIVMERVKARNFEELEPKGNGDQILLQRFDGKVWLPPLDVTGEGLRIWRPTVAVDGKGDVWVAWSQQIDGNWDIFYRRYSPPKEGGGGKWSDIVRLTDTPGADFHVVAATDAAGTVWLAWQGWRDNNFDILLAAPVEGHAWNKPRTISASSANDWTPAIAADSQGRVYVAWDSYDKGNYDVVLFTVQKNAKVGTLRPVADSPRFEARVNLVCDKQDRLWIAYEEGDEQWGKDYGDRQPLKHGLPKNPAFGLYNNRTVQVKCLAGDKLRRPAGDLQAALTTTLKRNKSVPRLAVDPAGGLWLLVRHHPLPGGQGEVWNSYALRYQGRQWSPIRRLASSADLLDNRPALMPLGEGILAVYSGDGRLRTANRDQDDLFAAILNPSGPTKPLELTDDKPSPAAEVPVVHKEEPADLKRMREYRVTAGAKKLRLLRGEFHRHTEFSSHGDQDGLLEDAWRYALDAANMDWIGNGDHDNGFGDEYMWWHFQKYTEMFQHPPRFVAMHVYERSVVYPDGHRNVIFPRPGIRPLPRTDLKGTPEKGTPDTKLLYAYLKHFGAICSSHTSATSMGTDWRDHDADVEPVVEIYQGCRHNYEHFGAPRSPTEKTQIGGYKPKGFVWNAFEKGYLLGFQASSDHVSTHISYAVVLTDDVSRTGIIDAFKKRHSYGATDNIVLDVHSGDHVMGDRFTSAQRPTLEIRVHGTGPIAKVHIIRDNKYVYSNEPKEQKVTLRYTDMDAKQGQSHYYYVRVEQADGNLAWASPMWITYQP
ncbi:MAG TPA: hypothetical protein VMF69_18240 [Gemmataceae bacterium]|nr:hypothetical protein [Gemmataceae bacterium]